MRKIQRDTKAPEKYFLSSLETHQLLFFLFFSTGTSLHLYSSTKRSVLLSHKNQLFASSRVFFQLSFKIDHLEPLICLNSRRRMSNFGNICFSLSPALLSSPFSHVNRKAIPHYLLPLFVYSPPKTVKNKLLSSRFISTFAYFLPFPPVCNVYEKSRASLTVVHFSSMKN